MVVKMFAVMMLALLPSALEAVPSFQQIGNLLVMSNRNVSVQYNLNSGTADFFWQNGKKISAFSTGVILNGTTFLSSTNYSARMFAIVGTNQIVITNSANGLPAMKQFFTFDQTDSFLTQVEMSAATNLTSNWMSPLMVNATGAVDIGVANNNRALFVPFDNDHFVNYNCENMNGSDTGNEVGAFFDATSRNGLVVGSVTHDTWKTGVQWSGSNNKLDKLIVFGGNTNHWTWDVMPHGSISGTNISSPTIFIGFNSDWRTALENFADENTNFAPRLVCTNGVPFGWNSWGVIQSGINFTNAIQVSDAIHTNLQNNNFTNDNTVFVNLDSYWNNLSDSQLSDFVNHCHANGQKAGVYWGPFVFWGNANDATNYFAPSPSGNPFAPNYIYRYSQILLRDNNGNFISNDGAYAIDPTHPGTLAMIDYYANYYTALGFDYVKLDFLSHGSLEGVHYDTNYTTGIQAFNLGMQRILADLAGKMFISESIAPIFPYQYGDSRRIACDAQNSKISDTAYTMNAVSYGWWIDRLYSFNDPDIMVFGNGADTNENQSRLINCAITGLFLDGDTLTNAASQAAARMCLTNRAINDVARVGKTFRPVDAANSTAAANYFVWQDGANYRIAVFNYTSSATNETVDLTRAGLAAGTYVATNLWDGTISTVSGSFNVSLNAKQSKLFSLAAVVAAPTISAQPISFTNSAPMYSGMPITISVAAAGTQPVFYQWFEIVNGMTNLISGATNASLINSAQTLDTNAPLNFFCVVSNNYGSVTSSIAVLNLSNILDGVPDAVSVQFALTNYFSYSSFFLAPTDTAGVYAVSNWNVFAITPSGGSSGTQPGVTFTNLADRFGITTPISVSVANVSDGWHQTAQTVSASDTANARLMNTFWKTHNDSSPSTNILYTTFSNVPNGVYSAYIYLLQNNSGATGYIFAGGVTNYFKEFTAFTSASNFVTAIDTNGSVNPFVNYLKLTGLSTGGSNSLTLMTVWTSGTDGIGVCGMQLVPAVTLAATMTNGQFQLQFPAPDGQSYVVETSSNLLNWIPIATNFAANGWFFFVNSNMTGPQKFYRVRQ